MKHTPLSVHLYPLYTLIVMIYISYSISSRIKEWQRLTYIHHQDLHKQDQQLHISLTSPPKTYTPSSKYHNLPLKNINTAVKCHPNSMVSTPGTQYTTIDINDIYLRIPMQVYVYMWIPLSSISLKIIELYNLTTLAKSRYVMVKSRRGMYGLP